ncbi:ribonuclease J [Breznakia sp. PF5-3]|uniref:ribonuclease J n=1 Tax=unclassified Breznakia TaxID=2623764 RepID=UPI002405C822|nr:MULTISPECIES: ribonuclease J [unclassified Breznakia]MDL2276687.1 ribonuclease J [Breznakia sp. OttesenSCG-928-G09]MDF9823935.1 ribonuclease J [Breznakia sp. PM6-1]MDF9834734.1 ribonuclease J [Breznakia sp. PF5-3]MDF9836831.1 ribonuclease J [Breznakia sp. PFB2-8]MDF9858848.1 ribonuclease J [Breznakia sp. PH5-24]
MDKVKIFALGGLDENGKNMTVVEVNNVIFIIEAGIMFPDNALLGVEYVIPDFTYLIENKDRIGGIFITHAHDDVMRALPFLLRQVNLPIYTGKFTSMFISDLLAQEGIKDYILNIIDRTSKFKVEGVEIRTFAMTHASPDNFGIAIHSSQGYIVYSGEFIIDYNALQPEYLCDLNELSEIGKEGVLCLLNESIAAENEGHTAPKHNISNKLEPIFESNEGRFIIACYRQSLYRILEVLDIAIKHKKKIFIRDNELRKTLKYLEQLGYYKLPKNSIIDKKDFNNNMKNVVVLVTGRGKRLFLKVSTIATHEDKYVELLKDDTIVVASPVVSGTEHEAVSMENEIYKEGGRIYSFKAKDVASMHPSSEDLKMAIYLFKPKYYLPIKGEYRHLITNANLASKMGFSDSRIILLDNGQMAEFVNRKLVSTNEILELEDTLIDGDANWDVTGVVLKDREWLSTDGVMIIGVTLDNKTKKIVSGIDVQTRGLIYVKDADYLVKEVMKIMEDTVKKAVKDRRYDNLECRQEAKDKIQKYLSKETGKRPMVLPVILEITNKA